MACIHASQFQEPCSTRVRPFSLLHIISMSARGAKADEENVPPTIAPSIPPPEMGGEEATDELHPEFNQRSDDYPVGNLNRDYYGRRVHTCYGKSMNYSTHSIRTIFRTFCAQFLSFFFIQTPGVFILFLQRQTILTCNLREFVFHTHSFRHTHPRRIFFSIFSSPFSSG